MSTLKVDNITGTGSSGFTGSVKSEGGATTTDLQQGLAKQWAQFDQRGDILGANTAGDTFNTTSFTDVEEGHIDVTIANDMANATYSVNASSSYNGQVAYDKFSRFVGASVVATGSFRLSSQWENDASQDAFFHGILVHGDLA